MKIQLIPPIVFSYAHDKKTRRLQNYTKKSYDSWTLHFFSIRSILSFVIKCDIFLYLLQIKHRTFRYDKVCLEMFFIEKYAWTFKVRGNKVIKRGTGWFDFNRAITECLFIPAFVKRRLMSGNRSKTKKGKSFWENCAYRQIRQT